MVEDELVGVSAETSSAYLIKHVLLLLGCPSLRCIYAADTEERVDLG